GFLAAFAGGLLCRRGDDVVVLVHRQQHVQLVDGLGRFRCWTTYLVTAILRWLFGAACVLFRDFGGRFSLGGANRTFSFGLLDFVVRVGRCQRCRGFRFRRFVNRF